MMLNIYTKTISENQSLKTARIGLFLHVLQRKILIDNMTTSLSKIESYSDTSELKYYVEKLKHTNKTMLDVFEIK